MSCQTVYDEMMSLQLDGMLDPDAERHLHEHVGACDRCATLWSAMQEADTLFIASAKELVAVPQHFTLKVMERVALTPVYRPQLEYELKPSSFPLPATISVVPPLVGAVEERDNFPVSISDYMRDLERRVSSYLSGIAAAGLSIAGAAAALLVLVMTGTLRLGDTPIPTLDLASSVFRAADTWSGTLLDGIGMQAVLGAGLVLAMLAIAGWQIVSNYHITASNRAEVSQVEATA